MKAILIIFLWGGTGAFAREELNPKAYQTEYVWGQDQENPFSGKCYEIDSETRGQRFSAKVPHFNCRPKERAYQWVADEEKYQGKCYEVDAATGTKGYSSAVSDSQCYPEKLEYVLAGRDCFVRGKLADGRELINKTSFEACRPKVSEFRFVYDAKINRGHCYEIDPQRPEGYEQRVEASKCRPAHTTFFFHEAEGRCYEIDSENGPSGYIDQTSREKCLETKSASFAFVGGECLQKAMGPSGEEVILKVALQKCRPDQVTHVFSLQSRLSGECYEVDQATLGERFRVKVAAANCRPAEVLYSFVASEGKCFEFDAKTRGSEYVNRVDDRLCQSESAAPTWRASEDNIYEGKCVGVVREGSGQEREVSHRNEKCRPAQTRYEWVQLESFKGRCYEVHSERGPRAFSESVAAKFCYPTEIDTVFFNLPGETIGVCAVVDKASGGQKFKRQVNARLCKEKMGLVSPE